MDLSHATKANRKTSDSRNLFRRPPSLEYGLPKLHAPDDNEDVFTSPKNVTPTISPSKMDGTPNRSHHRSPRKAHNRAGSIFKNARSLNISGGNFTVSQPTTSQSILNVADNRVSDTDRDRHRKAMETLRANISSNAIYNSAERFDAPKCYPETRLAVIEQIMRWIEDPNNIHLFLWIYGPAGCGKSAIAQTIAEMCDEERRGILAASFFFSRTSTGRDTSAHFIPTLSYQLCLSISGMRSHVARAVDRDPTVFSGSLIRQIKELIVDPLKNVYAELIDVASAMDEPRLVILDGLDECGPDAISQREVLDALAAANSQLPIPLFFLIASRPEHKIREGFIARPLNSVTKGLPLDDDYQAAADIRRFIVSRFNKIREDHPAGTVLLLNWPDPSDIDHIVIMSSGQFIYASAAMNYIADVNHHPKRRLEDVVQLSSIGSSRTSTPFYQIDALYTHVLSTVDPMNLPRLLELLSWIILDTSVASKSLRLADALFSEDRGDCRTVLNTLRSLLYIPEDESESLRFFHASFPDFLLDRSRSQKFVIDAYTAHTNLARGWIRYYNKCPPSPVSPGYEEDMVGLTSLDVTRAIFLHCANAFLSPELQTDLDMLDLRPTLCAIGPSPEEQWWPQLFLMCNFMIWLERQNFLDSNRDIYLHHLQHIRAAVQAHWSKYPPAVQKYVPLALTFPTRVVIPPSLTFVSPVDLITDLVLGLENSDILDLRIFGYLRESSLTVSLPSLIGSDKVFAQTKELLCRILTKLELPMTGPYYEDRKQYTQLALLLSENLFPLNFQSKGKLDNKVDLAILLRLSLSKAAPDLKLASFLRDQSLQFNIKTIPRPSLFSGVSQKKVIEVLQNLSLASLLYIKESGIRFRQHDHPDEIDPVDWHCAICWADEWEVDLSEDPIASVKGPSALATRIMHIIEILSIRIFLKWLVEIFRRFFTSR